MLLVTHEAIWSCFPSSFLLFPFIRDRGGSVFRYSHSKDRPLSSLPALEISALRRISSSSSTEKFIQLIIAGTQEFKGKAKWNINTVLSPPLLIFVHSVLKHIPVMAAQDLPTVLILGHSFVRRMSHFLTRIPQYKIPPSFSADFHLRKVCSVRMLGIGGRTIEKMISMDLETIRYCHPNI